VMYTPMVQEGDTFVTKLWVPSDTPIDYCFRITERRGLFDMVYPVCDGNYRDTPAKNSVREIKGVVTLNKDVSDVIDKRFYFFAGAAILLVTWLLLFFSLDLLETGLLAISHNMKLAGHNKLALASVIALIGIAGGSVIYHFNSAVTNRNNDTMADTQESQLVTQEFRYHLSEAGEVYLVWGIKGWQVVPEEQRPPGTKIEFGVMNTPMVLERDTFVVRVQVPAGTAVDYGFQTRKMRSGAAMDKWVWDGDYHLSPTKDNVIELQAAVTLAQSR
jgi:hypothetical protein